MRCHAAEMLPPSVDGVAGSDAAAIRLAQVPAMTGDRDGAFEELGTVVEVLFGLQDGDLKLNPTWDDLGMIASSIVSWRSLLCLRRVVAKSVPRIISVS